MTCRAYGARITFHALGEAIVAELRRVVLAVVVGLTVASGAGCTAPHEASTPTPAPSPVAAPSTAPAPAGHDLRELVIAPADVPVPGFLPPRTEPLGEDAVDGVVAFFDSDIDQRQLGVTIVLLPDPAAAEEATAGAAASTTQLRAGATSAPVPVGDRAVLFTGSELAGVSSTLLLFSQGNASVAMEFRTPSADPIPDDAVQQAGTRQAALLKSAFG